ncbi:hypothetical protein [Actinomadura miaoliensis]|uniref:Uncharacterized protein n=1 Tax=Actinomadura miaoliensis TaxID=430685 RepID=A0ABP7V887_9ACTN
MHGCDAKPPPRTGPTEEICEVIVVPGGLAWHAALDNEPLLEWLATAHTHRPPLTLA